MPLNFKIAKELNEFESKIKVKICYKIYNTLKT